MMLGIGYAIYRNLTLDRRSVLETALSVIEYCLTIRGHWYKAVLTIKWKFTLEARLLEVPYLDVERVHRRLTI